MNNRKNVVSEQLKVNQKLTEVNKGEKWQNNKTLLVFLFIFSVLLIGAGVCYYNTSEILALDSVTFLEDNVTKKNNEDYVIKDDIVYYINESGDEKLVVGASISTFVKINNKYGKDLDHIYYRGRSIQGDEDVDLGSFEVITDRYCQDKNSIYYILNHIILVPLDGVDRHSFNVIIDENDNYGVYCFAKDRDVVYYTSKKLDNVDSNSFEHIRYLYFRDKSKIYYNSAEIDDVDMKSFQVLNHWYSKDKNKVYVGGVENKGLDSKTFVVSRVLNHLNKDKNMVLYDGKQLEDVDVETFQAVSRFFAKDKNFVYWCFYGACHKKDFIDVASFVVFDDKYRNKLSKQEYFKDENSIYFSIHAKSVVEGADLDSFVSLGMGYAKDRNNAYYSTYETILIIKEVDLETFNIDSEGIVNDKNTIYSEGIKVAPNISGYYDDLNIVVEDFSVNDIEMLCLNSDTVSLRWKSDYGSIGEYRFAENQNDLRNKKWVSERHNNIEGARWILEENEDGFQVIKFRMGPIKNKEGKSMVEFSALEKKTYYVEFRRGRNYQKINKVLYGSSTKIKIFENEDQATEIIEHAVIPGETLLSISEKYNISIRSIQEENNLNSFSILRPGRILSIREGDEFDFSVINDDFVK